MDSETIKELVNDLDVLLGVRGNFWQTEGKDGGALETPDQIEDFARDLLVTFFGLEVQGL